MGWRRPCVAGSFYPADPGRLTAEIEACLGEKGEQGPGQSLPAGLILPHAGYLYSGPVAGIGYQALWRIGRPESVIILGTNHTGLGSPITVGGPGSWETPIGPLPVDDELASRLSQALRTEQSDAPFLEEHSIEVQLPFLRYLFGEIPFVPIVVSRLGFSQIMSAGEALSKEVADRKVALIASSDFTHYEPDKIAREKDHHAIANILNLNIKGFLDVVAQERITICGVGAIALLVASAHELGLTNAKLLAYRTSGEVVGMFDQVVGYAAVLFQRGSDV